MNGCSVRFSRQLVLAMVIIACAAVFRGDTPEARRARWQEVDAAIEQGLPRTAIERLEPIIAAALAQGEYAEAIRAIGRKVALDGTVEGNLPEVRIARFRDAIEAAPDAMRPPMQAILAHWQWHYFQRNR